MGNLRFILAIALMSLALSQAYARNREDSVPGARYTSARGQALGDALAPVVNDGTALFYNPAGLAKAMHKIVEPIHFQLFTNTDYVSKVASTNAYKALALNSIAPQLVKSPGYQPSLGGAVFPNVVMGGFGAGLLYSRSTSAVADDTGRITYRSRYQLIPTVGVGVRLASGVLRLGYSLQWVNQASGTVIAPTGATNLAYNSGIEEGSAFSHNAGFVVTLPFSFLPSLSIVGHNVGGARYKTGALLSLADAPTGAPAEDKTSIDAAIGWEVKTGQGGEFSWVLQYRDATNQSRITPLGRTSLGLEFGFRNSFFLRLGWGSGSPHGGIGFKRENGEVSFAWTAYDVGSTYKAETDRRFLVQYQLQAF